MKKYFLSSIVLASLLCFISCDEDKVEPENEITTFEIDEQKTEDFLENLRIQPEILTVTSADDFPITFSDGTEIWPNSSSLETENGDAVDYPFDIELTELYSAGDMISNDAPTVSGGKILSSGGEFNLTIKKDGEKLKIKDYYSITVNVPSENLDSEMELFLGGNADELGEWVQLSELTDTSAFNIQVLNDTYQIDLTDLGWINIDRFYQIETKASISVSVNHDGNAVANKNIAMFLYLEEINSTLNLNSYSVDGVISDLPAGQTAKLITFSIGTSGDVFYGMKSIVLEDGLNVDVTIEQGTTQDFETLLNSL